MSELSTEPVPTQQLLAALAKTVPPEAAWAAFVERFGPVILSWCRSWGLQDADAHDVSQEVLSRFFRRFRTLHIDPEKNFRSYLRKAVYHAWIDYVEGCKTRGAGGSAALERIHSQPARDDLEVCVERAYEAEVLSRAMERVRGRVTPKSWDAFRLLVLEGTPGKEVAATLGMEIGAVYVARQRLTKMIREEVELLEKAEQSPSP